MTRNLLRGGLRLALILAAALLGCSTDAALAPAPPPNSLYWNLRTDYHAVQLSMTAPGDSLQVSAASLNPSGGTWTPPDPASAPPVLWVSSDSTKVWVSSTGLLKAKGVTGTSNVRIVASRQVDNVTRADTVFVRVINETSPKVLTSFATRPLDSAKVAVTGTRIVTIRALDQANGVLNGAMCYFTTADTTIAKFVSAWTTGTAATTATVQGRKIGSTLVTATIWVYGVAMTDTFTLKVGGILNAYPTVTRRATVPVSMYLANDSVEIGPGGDVGFTNNTGANGEAGQSIDVTFADPSFALVAVSPNAASGAGNIVGIPSDTTISGIVENRRRHRRYLTPGVYTYTIQPYNLTGKIVVRAD